MNALSPFVKPGQRILEVLQEEIEKVLLKYQYTIMDTTTFNKIRSEINMIHYTYKNVPYNGYYVQNVSINEYFSEYRVSIIINNFRNKPLINFNVSIGGKDNEYT